MSQQIEKAAAALPTLSQLLAAQAEGSQLRVGPLTVDLGRQRWDPPLRALLNAFAREQDLPKARDRMFAGATINHTENRAVLHTALRAPVPELNAWKTQAGHSDRDSDDAANPSPLHKAAVATLVLDTRARMQSLVEQVHSGALCGHTGKRFTDIVNIGIGGSHLGPELVVEALGPTRHATHSALPTVHFVSNIDGHSLDATLRRLDPERTLFVVVSKSFGTLETALNADAIRSWFLERTGALGAIAQHFVAISNNVEAAAAFGLPPHRVLPMGDWVGGRYSLWSSAGLAIALGLGWPAFEALLAGASTMDQHFCDAELPDNLPVQAALSEWLNVNIYGCTSHAVLCYDDRLRLLPDYLQQLEMESNGKRTSRAGVELATVTQPVLWGGVGTNGQHAFHQLLHQGTADYFADFIFCAAPDHERNRMHRWLQANALAQSQGMAVGQTHDDPHRQVPGNHPSLTLVLDALTPRALGTLLAAYEHKVFCLGVLWDINSFDQWGVELGKALAKPLERLLANPADGVALAAEDASMQALINLLNRTR